MKRASPGAQLAEIRHMIDADKTDLYDVLAYIAFALPTITHEERVDARRAGILVRYDEKKALAPTFARARGCNGCNQGGMGPRTISWPCITRSANPRPRSQSSNFARLRSRRSLFPRGGRNLSNKPPPDEPFEIGAVVWISRCFPSLRLAEMMPSVKVSDKASAKPCGTPMA